MSNTFTPVFVGTAPCSCQFQLIGAEDEGAQCPAAADEEPIHTTADGADFGPIPTPFRAATRKVYLRLFVKPVTVSVVFFEWNWRALSRVRPR